MKDINEEINKKEVALKEQVASVAVTFMKFITTWYIVPFWMFLPSYVIGGLLYAMVMTFAFSYLGYLIWKK